MSQDRDRSEQHLKAEIQALRTRNAELTQALEISQNRYEQLIESASDGIVLVGDENDIIRVNARAEEMFGYSREELLGQPIEILIPARLRDSHRLRTQRYTVDPKPRPMGIGLDLVGRRKDGTEFPVEVGLSPMRIGSEVIVTCFISDITPRKRVEAAVQETLEQLQKRNRDLALLNQVGRTLTATLDPWEVVTRLLHAVTEAIEAQAGSVWLWDKEQPGWLVCNAAFDHGKGLPLLNLRLAPGQGIAGWVAQHRESVITNQASNDSRFSSDIDSEIGFETSSLLAAPILLRDEVIGVLEVVNKRTGEFDQDDRFLVETLAASAAVALDNARLVEQLREQTAELQTRNEELDAFAHTVAHDLKGPVGIVMGFSEALEANLAAIPHEDLQRHLRTITRNGRRMNSIIKELLLMASVRTTQMEVSPLDTAAAIAEALDRLAHITENSQVIIVQPESWPVALGYAPWIEEVWVNYISNAIKYGGTPPRVELGATVQHDGCVRFWTRDNGSGIKAEDRERLFAPFTQLQPMRAQGHGLGLSIARRIVEKLGGTVGVDSQPGQGSTFYFTLPGPSTPQAGCSDQEPA